MLPSNFVFLDALPRTLNGKMNRKALPAHRVATEDNVHPSLPASELEQVIASIWQEVLNVPSVSVATNFFDLGGHSLLAVQVHRRLVERVNPELKLTDLFRFPTIRTLGDFLKKQGEEWTPPTQKAFDRADRRRQAAALRAGRRGSPQA